MGELNFSKAEYFEDTLICIWNIQGGPKVKLHC